MRGTIVKMINDLVPDNVANTKRGKKAAWKKLNTLQRSMISSTVRKMKEIT